MSAAPADNPDAPVELPGRGENDDVLATVVTTTATDGDGSAGPDSCAETDADGDTVSVALLDAETNADAVPVDEAVPAIGEDDGVRDAVELAVRVDVPETETVWRALVDGFAVFD